jgi:hypothetical protein
MRRNTRLPDGFEWSASDAISCSDGNVFLVHNELDIAVVRRIGNGWIAVIDSDYCCSGTNSCIVPSLWKGQCWIAAWLRRDAAAVSVLVKYRHLHSGQSDKQLDKQPLLLH